jgi:hypothetical protein
VTATTTTASQAAGRLLSIYLNDHLAGSTAAVELVRRAARAHQDTELGGFLSRLAAEIAADRQALRHVMAAAGAQPQVLKIALAWLAEKAGRLKLNGRLLRRSPLSSLMELEAVEVGIYGKLLLWQVLRDQRPPGAAAADLDELIARAERQLADVERHRLTAGSALLA